MVQFPEQMDSKTQTYNYQYVLESFQIHPLLIPWLPFSLYCRCPFRTCWNIRTNHLRCRPCRFHDDPAPAAMFPAKAVTSGANFVIWPAARDCRIIMTRLDLFYFFGRQVKCFHRFHLFRVHQCRGQAVRPDPEVIFSASPRPASEQSWLF